MRPALILAPCLLLTQACTAPPRPPVVDEATRRPANTTQAVELQVCQNDLHNTRILARESGRLADATSATLQHVAARQQWLAALQAATPASSAAASAPTGSPDATARTEQAAPTANSIFTVYFAFGSKALTLPPDTRAALLAQARQAPLLVLRGRTDGQADSPAETRMARERAEAVQAHLVAAGIAPARIRTTYQPTGDHAADNTSPTGRALNRRVEIEVYRTLPMAMAAVPHLQP